MCLFLWLGANFWSQDFSDKKDKVSLLLPTFDSFFMGRGARPQVNELMRWFQRVRNTVKGGQGREVSQGTPCFP